MKGGKKTLDVKCRKYAHIANMINIGLRVWAVKHCLLFWIDFLLAGPATL